MASKSGIKEILKKSQERFEKKQRMPAVELRNLLVDFGGVIAVNNVNLKINQGELVTLLGPSGCGKTTTLNAIAGLLKPTSGMILFKGKDITNYAPQKRKLGLVFQNYALYPHMSVYKNIAFPLLNDEAWQSSIKKENDIIKYQINKIIFKTNGATDDELNHFEKRFFAIYDVKREVYSQFNKYKSRTSSELNTLIAKKDLLKPHYKSMIKKISEDALKVLLKIDSLEKNEKNKRINILKNEFQKKKAKAKDDLYNGIRDLKEKIDIEKVKLKELEYRKKLKELKFNLKSLPKKSLVTFKKHFIDLKNKYSLSINKISSSDLKKIQLLESKIIKLKDAINKKIMEVANKVEITQNLQKNPTKLSGGQQQRVAIARGIVKNPDILLMDEPLSNLDAKLRIQTRNWIRAIQKELGITLIFVTHDQEEAMAISDKIVCLNDGNIQQVGSPLELYEKPKNEFVAKFLGMPEMKIVAAEVTKTGTVKLFGKKLIDIDKKIKKVNLGIRADDFIESPNGFIKGVIKSVEYLGKEIRAIIELDYFGNTSVTLSNKTNYKIGEEVKLNVVTKKIHFFDAKTKEHLDV